MPNPGYITPDTTTTYFFSGRGAFTTDDITRTDLSLNYSINFGRFEFFIQPSVINLFNEDGAFVHDNAVITQSAFNPFTTSPIEGTHYRLGDDFGSPQEEDDIQRVREYRLTGGFRF